MVFESYQTEQANQKEVTFREKNFLQ